MLIITRRKKCRTGVEAAERKKETMELRCWRTVPLHLLLIRIRRIYGDSALRTRKEVAY